MQDFHKDYSPSAILDIGANRGEWSRQVHQKFPDAKFLMLEATPKHNVSLSKTVEDFGGSSNAEYHIAVMSGKAGETVNFFQGEESDTGNSMFQENTKFYANTQPIERITSTVDIEVQNSLLRDMQIDLMKIDVQGAELLVLEGARETLARVTWIHLELSAVNYNPGGACYFEVDSFLRSQGFFLHDHGDVYRSLKRLFKTHGIAQYDALYVNPSAPNAPNYIKDNPTLFCGQSNKQQVHEKATTTSEQQDSTDGGGIEASVSAVEATVIDPITQYTDDMLKQYIKNKMRRRTVVLLLVGHCSGMVFMWFLMKCLNIKRALKKL